MSGVANIEKWKKEKNKVRRDKLELTLRREHARRGCTGTNISNNNQKFCDEYKKEVTNRPKPVARKKKTTRKAKKPTGKAKKTTGKKSVAAKLAAEHEACGIDADCAAKVNLKMRQLAKENKQPKSKATSSNKIKNKQTRGKVKKKQEKTSWLKENASDKTKKCVKLKASAFTKAKTEAKAKTAEMIKVYTKHSYGCYTIKELIGEAEFMIKFIKTNKVDKADKLNVYERLKAIEQVLQAKKATIKQRNKVKKAAASLGTKFGIQVKYKF